MFRLHLLLALAIVLGTSVASGPADAEERWSAPSAVTTLSFNPDILRDLGVEITD